MTDQPTTDTRDDGLIIGLRLGKIVTWVVYAYLVIAVVVLVLAFFLMLFNASTTAEFTEWVYRSAERVLQPFRGIFPTAELGEQGSVIDFAVLFAIIMYGIFAMLVSALVRWLDDKIDEHRLALAQRRYEARLQQAAQSQTPSRAQAQSAPQAQNPPQQAPPSA